MAKNNDKIEEYIIEQKIEDGIRKGITRRVIAVCMTATSAALAIFYQIGGFIYQKWEPLQAAFKAFYEANKP